MAKRKPGKYDHLLPKLKKWQLQDLAYQEKVEAAKHDIRVCQHCTDGQQIGNPTGDDVIQRTCTACNGTGRRTLTGATLATDYVVIRAQKELLEAAVSAVGIELEAATQLLIASQEQGQSDWGAFGASDRAVKLTNGDTLRVQSEPYAMVKDKQIFREWCYANGLRSKMELPEKPCNDLVKLRLLNGDTEPEGVEVYVRTRIVYTPLKTEATPARNATSDADDDTTIF